MKILVRAPNWLGDQVLAYPFYHYLRQAYPAAHITSVCVEWVEAIQFRDLINQVYVLPRLITGSWVEKFKVMEQAARELREKGPWDLGISLPNSFTSAWLLYRTGVKRRRGYSADARGFLLNESLAWDDSPNRHRSQAYVDLLPQEVRPTRPVREFWGVPAENELDDPMPGELSEFNGALSWPDAQPLEPPREPYWVLAPGATAESRRWPLEYFAVLAFRIASETGLRGVIVGGPKEAPLASQLCEDRRLKLHDWTAQCPVSGLWRVFRNARFTVTNESGLAHVASLCGSKVQIVCGAADPRRTQPLGPGVVQVAINPVECWPCERNTCWQPPGQKVQCLKGILPENVWGEIQSGLRVN